MPKNTYSLFVALAILIGSFSFISVTQAQILSINGITVGSRFGGNQLKINGNPVRTSVKKINKVPVNHVTPKFCGAGLYRPSEGAECTQSLANYYSPSQDDAQYLCPDGKPSQAGSSSVDQCGNPASIQIRQGTTDIEPNGSYDFGSITPGESSDVVTFTIENTGDFDLELTSSPKVVISGPDTDQFTVDQSSITSPLGQGATTSFDVTFSPTTDGDKTITLSVDHAGEGVSPYVFSVTGAGAVSGGFIMQIQIDSPGQSFTISTRDGAYTYDATVDWGDGTTSLVTGHNINNTHTYASAGTYDVEIKGEFDAIRYALDPSACAPLRKILNWGQEEFSGFSSLYQSFMGCSNLNELANGGIKEKTASPITNLTMTFYGNNLTTIPADLFRYNTLATQFPYTFTYNDSLRDIPADLFRYNTLATNFRETFSKCDSLTSIPADLFRYNTAATDFQKTFAYNDSLTNVPADLFRYNTLATDFDSTFYEDRKLTLRNDIFGTDYANRFKDQSIDFRHTFYRANWTGSTAGNAPELWNFDFGTGTPHISSPPFGGAGNSTTSLTNYNSIPAGWK